MQADFDNMNVGDYVMITSSVELEDNAKLYCKTETEWVYITDFSGATGIQGEKGDKGDKGDKGEKGDTGVGISTLEVIDGALYVTLTNNVKENAGVILTDEVKAWLVSQITDNAESDFNEFYNSKVTEFNNNATEKTTAYNTNAEDKLNEYNTNATNKISEYNSNAEAILKLLPNKTTEIQEVIDVDDSAESSFNNLKVFGNSQQKRTTGAAKVDFGAFAGDYSDEQMEIKIDENGIISLKGTVSAYYSKKIGTLTKDMFVAGNNAYYARSNNSNNSIIFIQSIGSISFSSVNNSSSFEITDESQESDLYIVVNYLKSGTLNVNEILYPMISLESNTLYEPYTGGNPSPNPDYPQEINSVGRKSKNILDISNLYTESTINGVNVKYNNDGTLALKGTSTASIDLYLREGVPLEHGNYSYKCFGLPENIYTNIYYAGDVYGETVKNFTVSNDNNYGIVIKIPINTTIDAVIKPMLVKGFYYSTSFPKFEPFYNTNIIKFKRIKKNFLDMSNAKGGTYAGITVEIKKDGSYSYVGTATNSAINVWLRGAYDTYNSYRSWEELDKSLILFKLPKGNYVVKDCIVFYVLKNSKKGNSSNVLNLEDDAYVVAVRAIHATVGNIYNEIKYPSILNTEEDSVATEYEPYHEDIYIVNFSNTLSAVPGFGDYYNYTDENGQRYVCDEIDFKRGKLIKRTMSTILPKTGWQQNKALEPLDTYYEIVNFNALDSSVSAKGNSTISNYFDKYSNKSNYVAAIQSSIYIRFPLYTGIDTLEKAREFMETHDVEVVYILKTPIEIDLTDNQLEQFKLDKGINHIYSDDELSPRFQLKYYQDMNILLDKINKNIADVSAEII